MNHWKSTWARSWSVGCFLFGMVVLVGCGEEEKYPVCLAESCNGHGQCDVSSGVIVCHCHLGYAGKLCDTCATGFQDNDADGVCLANCETALLTCGKFQHCDDSKGTVGCVCNPGHVGEDCLNCDEGYRPDSDGNCISIQTCSPETCHGHGTCDDSDFVVRCQCQKGYVGNYCENCAPDYFEWPKDSGTCEPSPCRVESCLELYHQVPDSCKPLDLEYYRCDCLEGYGGDLCEACAQGYQDHDDDGTCQPNCLLAQLFCSGHGQCDDSSGTSLCVCQNGYTGEACEDCTEGFQDHDSNGSCLPTCSQALLECGEHGHCQDGSGIAICICDLGYAGDDCSSCEQDYQDHDGNGTCLPGCNLFDSDCSGHGICDDASGIVRCLCQPAYTGEECQDCAQGYQDHDGNGSCLPNCQTAQLACPIHAVCDDSSGEAVCVCQEGYTGEECNHCDSGFQDHDENGTCLPSCQWLGYDCSGNGVCDDSSGYALCLCDPDFVDSGSGHCLKQGTGENCQSPYWLNLKERQFEGSTRGALNNASASCVYKDSEERVYTFEIVKTTRVVFETSGFDTVLHLRSECENPASEIACNDDGGPGRGSRIEVELTKGQYSLFVDGFGTNVGEYVLTVDLACTSDELFDPITGECVDNPCLPNPCEIPHQQVCEPILPGGFRCVCDPGYVFDPENPGTCIINPDPTGDTCRDPLLLDLDLTSTQGSTQDAINYGRGKCAGTGPDRIYAFSLEHVSRVEFLMEGYDTVLHLRSDCEDKETELACNDDGGSGQAAQFSATLQPGTYFLFADSFSSGGDYTLSYSVRTSPCALDPCPGLPECVPFPDWSGYDCVCPEGTLPWEDDCVDDPCLPNPCDLVPYKTRCLPELPGDYVCLCKSGYIDDGNDGCTMDPNANEWSVLVFLNADNNLDSYGHSDVNEMTRAGSTPYVNIVALFDTYAGPANIIYIKLGDYEIVDAWGEVDMGLPQTLSDFGLWAIENYPARHYALIMWDHGDGWRAPASGSLFKAFSNDDHPGGSSISIADGDYAEALQTITQALGTKIDIVGFDACLMGMWEIADASAPYANYLVASSETEPADGWPYDDFLIPLIQNHEMTPAELGMAIVDAYSNKSSQNATLAVTDLQTRDEMANAVDGLALALLAHPDRYNDIDTARSGTQTFYFSEYRDLGHFAERLLAMPNVPSDIAQAAAALIDQIGVSVIYNKTQSGYLNSTGLAVYFPRKNGYVESRYMNSGATWSQRTHWDEFLVDFTTR